MTHGERVPRLPDLPLEATPFAHRSCTPIEETSTPMKLPVLRLLAAMVALALAAALLGAAAPSGKVLEPSKLIILSTTDVKGKNEPCG